VSAPAQTFFRSRWVEVPDGVTEAPGGLPEGFRAAGVAAGLKESGNPDVGLLVCDAPDATSAARFTRSGVLAAPVVVTKQRAQLAGLRAVAVNSGNANAATGGRGLDDAAKMQGAAAIAAGVPHERVAVASTGVIGVPLDTRAVVSGLARAAGQLRPDGDADFTAAIMTTDAFEKRAALDVTLPSGGTVWLTAQAKGDGMIRPSFATMLCFVQTDAALGAETADLLLGVTVKRSFDRISVDGQLSTNDTALLMASGASGVTIEPESPDELHFGQTLDALLRQLALEIVRDGEGAARIGRIVVQGADGVVEPVARSVADSPLVKTALHGGDPNFGRILQAAGQAFPPGSPFVVDLEIEGRQLVSAGDAIDIGPEELAELEKAMLGDEVEFVLTLPGEGGETEVFFSDLSEEYVTYNASYTS